MEDVGRNNHGYKKVLWTAEEDRILTDYIKVNGKGKWNRVTKLTGLKRCGKSCRLRWMNYLNPTVKRGDFSEEENDLIIRLHNLLGNSWSLIAGRVPGRTDNQVKNHWNSHLSKKLGVVKTKANKSTRRSSKSKTSNSTTSDQSQAISPKEKSKSSVEPPPLPPKEDSNCGGDGDEGAALPGGHDREESIDSKMWETMMQMGGDYDDEHHQGSFWFYNNNDEDDLGLFKNSNYFVDPCLDYSFDSLDDIGF